MVRIAYILTPIEFGGAEKVNVTFLQNVNRNRYDIHLILLIRPWEKDNTFIDIINNDNFFVTKIPVAKKNPSEGKDYLRVARCVIYLHKILSKSSYDVVHSHGYFADIISAMPSKLLNIPHMSTCHGFIANDKNLKIYNKFDKYVLRSCKKVIAVSSVIRDELVSNGVKQSKIRVIQNAIECKYNDHQLKKHRVDKRRYLSIEEKEYLIGFVGRLSDEKGVNYLIEAASMLKKISIDFKIAIVGDGQKKNELISLANSKGLDSEIIFAGFQKDIEKWIPAFDVFVLPSLTEGTPMALLEAMSMGVPVIASAVGGVPSVLDHEVNGLLVEPGDSKALYKNIKRLLYDPLLRKKLVYEAISTIVERFDSSVWCRTIENEYDSLLQND